MLNNLFTTGGAKDDQKIIKFFEYKRNMQNVMDQFIENGGFADQDQMKEFIYNEQQENPDGVIMEVNTANAGGPGMIEVIDGADIAYIKSFPNSTYGKFINKLSTSAVFSNTPNYFENYVLSELKNKNAERIIVLFSPDKQVIRGPEAIGLDREYADYLPLDAFKKILKENKRDLENTLLIGYGFSQTYKSEENFKAFKKIFKDRYLNEEETLFSSKLWPSLLGREELTGNYMSKTQLKETYGDILTIDDAIRKDLETSYVAKELFIDQGKGIFFPGEWNFTDNNDIKTKNKKVPIVKDYVLQRFHELPRKITLENGGLIVPKTVDIRAFVTFDVEKEEPDIQLFGREGNIGSVNNVSSGGKFTKIYTVPDESYYDMQTQMNALITSLGSTQNKAIETYFDEYSRNGFEILPEARISHIPFILSVSGTRRIVHLVNKLVYNMVDVGLLAKNDDGRIVGSTVLGVDVSVNPLPEKTKK